MTANTAFEELAKIRPRNQMLLHLKVYRCDWLITVAAFLGYFVLAQVHSFLLYSDFACMCNLFSKTAGGMEQILLMTHFVV